MSRKLSFPQFVQNNQGHVLTKAESIVSSPDLRELYSDKALKYIDALTVPLLKIYWKIDKDRKNGVYLFMTRVDDRIETPKKQEQNNSFTPPSPPNIEQPSVELEMFDLDINYISVEPGTNDFETPSINYDDLVAIIDNNSFVSDFSSSLQRLYRYKHSRYQELKASLQISIDQMLEEFEKMKRKDRNAKLNDQYPQVAINQRIVFGIDSIREKMSSFIQSPPSLSTLRDDLNIALLDEHEGLVSLTGRQGIKDLISQMLYSFSQNFRSFASLFNNILLYGNAGVGKTRTANVIAFVLGKSHLLLNSKATVATRSDLVGQYIGQTAPKTRSMLMTSLESVLLLDEAYELGQTDKQDFGGEAITEIVNFIDKYIGMSMLIAAGYEDEMKIRFVESNQGIPRRFPHVLVLNDYSNEELTEILVKELRQRALVEIDSDTASIFYSLIGKIRSVNPDAFNNQAGDMLNLASALLRAVGSAYHITWIDGNIEHNFPIILSAFNSFLDPKGGRLDIP